MLDIEVPHERFQFFRQELCLGAEELETLAPYRHLFLGKKEAFGHYFYDYFHKIPRTRLIIDHDKSDRRLQRTLTHWFESLFTDKLNEDFLSYLWRSGIRHVEVNLDQRYVNLGYAAARQFCQSVIQSEIPLEEKQKVTVIVDKMLDLCVLVATDSYVTATSRCDMEVIKGVAHQVRNPLTVIGGNILRLQKKLDTAGQNNGIFESILQEAKRLERMVTDIGIYNDIFREDPRIEINSLEHLIREVLDALIHEKNMQNLPVELHIDPRFAFAKGDPHDLQVMFRYLLENSLEAVNSQMPSIRIVSRQNSLPQFVRVEIFNTGNVPRDEEVDNFFTPFFSSKPTGTGFGLPIARLIARKNLGNILIEPVPGKGTRCVVLLPMAREGEQN